MQYHHVSYEQLETFCHEVFKGYHFTEEESRQITDVLLAADLSGIESHGIQRLIRYHQEITGGLVKLDAKPEVVFETPLSAVIEGNDCMGQTLGIQAMNMAIDKARQHGFGMITVRNSNHYGIAGYYAKMAVKEEMIGMCMTNTEAIMVPTFGRQAMLGTNPIAFAMPADPIPFWFDAAMTVVPRGKLEVYAKQGKPMPLGWAVDENGKDTSDAKRVIDNINSKAGGGILPLGGSSPATGSHKGYGLALIVEILSSIIAGGATSNHVSKNGLGDTSQSFFALDYGMFGDKAAMRESLSTLLQELRDSAKAEGRTRIYTSGEMEVDSRNEKLKNGIPVNDSTLAELRTVGGELGLDFDAMVSVKAAE